MPKHLIFGLGLILVFLSCLAFLYGVNPGESTFIQLQFSFLATSLMMFGVPLAPRWHLFVPLIFFYMTISGFVSNILYPAKLPLLFLDFIILYVYIAFFISLVGQREPFPRHLISRITLMVMAMGGAQMFNAFLPSFLAGLVGFKVLAFHVPLLIVGYYYASSFARIYRLLVFIASLSIGVALIACFEAINPRIFQELGEGLNRAFVWTAGGLGVRYIRVPGTFSRPQLFGLYCFFILSPSSF